MEGSLIVLGMFVQVGTNTAELGILGVPMLVVLPTNILDVVHHLV
jgi:lipid A disaccharide synthetase